MERYTELCKQFLLLDNPEAVQVIFPVLNSRHSEFRPFFVNQSHRTIRDHYLVTDLKHTRDWSVIFTRWEAANPEWPAKLQAALFAGNVGACARLQKMSLLQYEAGQNADVSL